MSQFPYVLPQNLKRMVSLPTYGRAQKIPLGGIFLPHLFLPQGLKSNSSCPFILSQNLNATSCYQPRAQILLFPALPSCPRVYLSIYPPKSGSYLFFYTSNLLQGSNATIFLLLHLAQKPENVSLHSSLFPLPNLVATSFYTLILPQGTNNTSFYTSNILHNWCPSILHHVQDLTKSSKQSKSSWLGSVGHPNAKE